MGPGGLGTCLTTPQTPTTPPSSWGASLLCLACIFIRRVFCTQPTPSLLVESQATVFPALCGPRERGQVCATAALSRGLGLTGERGRPAGSTKLLPAKTRPQLRQMTEIGPITCPANTSALLAIWMKL